MGAVYLKLESLATVESLETIPRCAIAKNLVPA